MKRKKSTQKNAAKKIVEALAESAGGAKGAKELAKKALANFKETPVSNWGDFFVAMRAKETVLIRSGTTYLNETLVEFLEGTLDWTRVELQWWCDDQKMPHKPPTERAAIRAGMKLRLFWVERVTGRLRKIAGQRAYQRIRGEKSRMNRQFVLIDVARFPEKMLATLSDRIRQVHGKAALKKPLRF